MADENETLNTSEAANSEPSKQGNAEQERDQELQNGVAEADQVDGEDEKDESDEDGSEDDERKRRPSRSERQARQIQRLRAEIDDLKSGRAAPAAAQDDASIAKAVKDKIGEPPKQEDFKDWFDFRDKMSEYNATRAVVEMQIKDEAGRARGAEEGRIRGLLEDYDDHLHAAGKANPELIKALKESKFEPSPALAIIVLEAGENAPLIAYHLTKNPREAERINALSPIAAAREIGRIEALVSAPKKKATAAPKPVSGGPRGGSSPNRGPGQSMDDYARWRNSQ